MIPLARWGMLYHEDDTRPRLILLPASHDWDPSCGAPACSEDLDMDSWFPRARKIDPVDYFPGTRTHLANGYDIVTLRRASRSDCSLHRSRHGVSCQCMNRSLCSLFHIGWSGSVVVVKRAKFRRDRAVSITRPEVSLINAVVQRCVRIFESCSSASYTHAQMAAGVP